MIQRINLIEKQAFSFTYQKLLQICAVVVALIVLMVGSQFIRVYRLKPQIEFAKVQLDELSAQNADLTAQPVKKKVNIGQYQQLFDLMQAIPEWSELMRLIGTNMPNSVWINTFKSLGSSTPVVVENHKNKKDDKNAKEEKAPVVADNSTMKVEITGTSTDIRAVAEFTSKLEKSQDLKNVILTNTSKENFGYSFVLQGEVITDYAK